MRNKMRRYVMALKWYDYPGITSMGERGGGALLTTFFSVFLPNKQTNIHT